MFIMLDQMDYHMKLIVGTGNDLSSFLVDKKDISLLFF